MKDGCFETSDAYKQIIKCIKSFLVEAANNIASVAFNFLCEEKLKASEAKDYASKNLMLNMRSIYAETIKAINVSYLFDVIE
jgi:hypothetical protein